MLFKQSLKYPDAFNLISGKINLDDKFTSINRCIGLILTTGKGELLGDPEFGCRLYELLFEQYNDDLQSEVKQEIVNSIQEFEPRVIVDVSGISINSIDNSEKTCYNINIKYRLASADIVSETEVVVVERDIYGE